MSEPDPPGDEARERFFLKLRSSLADGTLHRLVLSRPRNQRGPSRIDVRRISLRGEGHLSFVSHHATNDVTKNHAEPAGLAEIERCAGRSFLNVHLFTRDEEWQLRFGKRGTCHVSVSALAKPKAVPDATAHDRRKARCLDANAPFLRELGLTAVGGSVVPAMARKWKQIDRFVELFGGAVAASRLADTERVRVADFGAGLGYLTFAVHDWLLQHGKQAEVTGVELREDLVQKGNDAALRLGLQGLVFAQGDVQHHVIAATDVLIALHACDIATDHALAFGVRAGAEVLLTAPCCHKELRPQLHPPAQLQAVLRHGVYQGETAEMVTDAVRALVLEAHGYATQVFEFVSLEHTAKNTMIQAVKRRTSVDPEPALAEARALLAFYGVREHSLLRLCGHGDATVR